MSRQPGCSAVRGRKGKASCRSQGSHLHSYIFGGKLPQVLYQWPTQTLPFKSCKLCVPLCSVSILAWRKVCVHAHEERQGGPRWIGRSSQPMHARLDLASRSVAVQVMQTIFGRTGDIARRVIRTGRFLPLRHKPGNVNFIIRLIRQYSGDLVGIE